MAVKKVKLTPSFPADVKPARSGVYELPYGYWARYAKGLWYGASGSPEEAAATKSVSLWPRPEERDGPDQCFLWRGLAEQPK